MVQRRDNLKGFVIAMLRRASYRWPPRSQVLRAARRGRGKYECVLCGPAITHGRKEVQVDHKVPVIPLTGWDTFDAFIERLFCDVAGLQVLCKPCHSVKTKAENAKRSKKKK